MSVTFKVEAALPTGSFKDRGSSVMVSRLAERGVERIVVDSSGNAGASVAAYCARAGIDCLIFAPATASPAKLGQIEAYGASVELVPGPRSASADAAREAAANGAVYTSHAWSPLFLAGTRTFAFELWEQLGRTAPDAVVVPVGSGTLLLGACLGFEDLRAAGLAERVPRVFGVQVDACAPLARAAETGAAEPVDVAQGPSAADGIMIARPPRGREILAAVRRSGGTILAVGEDALWSALAALGGSGLYVEPTSAVAAAGASHLLETGLIGPEHRVAVGLTGSGLKAVQQIRDGLRRS